MRTGALTRMQLLLGLLWLAERAWKGRQVARFFRRPVPAPAATP